METSAAGEAVVETGPSWDPSRHPCAVFVFFLGGGSSGLSFLSKCEGQNTPPHDIELLSG